MEYEKDTEAIKGNDLKQSLNAEKTKCLELMDRLNQEKKRANSMQEQLGLLNDEVVSIKQRLNAETTNLHAIWYGFLFIQINLKPRLIYGFLAKNSTRRDSKTSS